MKFSVSLLETLRNNRLKSYQAMKLYRSAFILIFLMIFSGISVAQDKLLWNIYRDKEEVISILELKHFLNRNQIFDFKKRLINEIRLEKEVYLEPMFPNALSPNNLEQIFGFRPNFDLRNFYTLIVSADENILSRYNNPFDFARFLSKVSSMWGEYSLISVEPDLPLSAYQVEMLSSSSSCPDKGSSPKDRAWHLRNMKVPDAWRLSNNMQRPTKGLGIKIGHPDTGYSEHIDLDDEALKKIKGNNFIEKDRLPIDPLAPKTNLTHPGHGTSTGSVIISRGDVTESSPTTSEGGTSGRGKVTGAAAQADLVPYRAIRSVARFTYGNVEKAIYKAVNDNCFIISISLGGIGHSALNAAMEYAIGNNVIVIAAAGNRPARKVVYPAKYPFCIGVAASNIEDKPWNGSAKGIEVAVSAPGEAVWRALRTQPNENTEIVKPSCGTSYSTANVAGVAALWLAHHKRDELINQFNGKTKLQFVFKRLLRRTARHPKEWNDTEYGSGIVDAEKLLNTEPTIVREAAIKDFEEFKKVKRESAENNLGEIADMYFKIWFNRN